MMRNRFGEKQGSGNQYTLRTDLGKTLESLGVKSPHALRIAKIQSIWEEVAPSEVLKHTDNVFLFKDRHTQQRQLIIYVDSPLWAAELMAQKEQFKLRFEQVLDEGKIDTISFRPSSFAYQRKEFRKRVDKEENDKVISVPLTEMERQQIIAETSYVENERLRNAVIRARIANKQWQKGLAEQG